MEKYKSHHSAIEACAHRARDGEYTTKFTHCDLAPRNILVDPKTFRILSIIDWESGGWYPEWWEYTRTHMSNALWQPEWWEILSTQVLQLYPEELEVELVIDAEFERF